MRASRIQDGSGSSGYQSSVFNSGGQGGAGRSGCHGGAAFVALARKLWDRKEHRAELAGWYLNWMTVRGWSCCVGGPNTIANAIIDTVMSSGLEANTETGAGSRVRSLSGRGRESPRDEGVGFIGMVVPVLGHGSGHDRKRFWKSSQLKTGYWTSGHLRTGVQTGAHLRMIHLSWLECI